MTTGWGTLTTENTEHTERGQNLAQGRGFRARVGLARSNRFSDWPWRIIPLASIFRRGEACRATPPGEGMGQRWNAAKPKPHSVSTNPRSPTL
jgi:hypothetical protein